MKACGYMELMATASGDGLFRWLISPDLVLTQSAKEFAEPIAVSPDGDIYVSAYVPAAVRWELEMVWERKVVDVITIYRVNEKAALKAMERRFTCADVIAMLERAADQPL
ncbi:hypothetical protein K0U00_50165, partial [Paenibacillus sepulcri]|nr:hypothetical protein [Paenibacillus sepulcri]